MKTDFNATTTQVIFAGAKALINIGLISGMAILFVQVGTGAFVQSWDALSHASEILNNIAS